MMHPSCHIDKFKAFAFGLTTATFISTHRHNDRTHTMYLNRQRLAAAIALTLPALSQATPFSIFEARGFAMGGAGVASSEQAAASLYNPALLAAPSDTNRFSFILPAVGVRASGTEGAVDAIKNLNDHNTIDNLTAAANNFSNAYNTCSANGTAVAGCQSNGGLMSASRQVASAAAVVRDDLDALNGKVFNVNAGAVAAIALPKWEYKGALSLNVEFFGKATPTIASSDTAKVNTVISGAQLYGASGNISDLSSFVDANGDLIVGDGGDSYSNSNFKVIGVAVADIGLSFAKAVNVGDTSLLVGLTPKIQQVSTVSYTANVDNSDFDLKKNKKTDSGFNIDLGLAKTFDADSPYEKVRLGLVVRNLIPHTYKTVDAQDIKMAPQVRVGAAWTGKYGTITSDLDLTANKIVGTGSDASQVFAIGGEFNAWNVLKLRAGYRNDIKAKYGAVTAGVSLLGVQLSAAYAKDRELAAMLQFGASF
jgi:hypothetical protein